MILQQAEGCSVDLGEQANLRKVTADQGEIVLVVELTQATNALYRILVTDHAAQRIGGVGRIDHHAAATNDFHGLFYQACLRVFRVNLEKLTHTCSQLMK